MGRRSDHRLDLTASELRKAAQREKDSTAARRMLALALVLEGADRRRAAESCGMDRQTLRDWVHRLAWPGFGRASRLVLFRNSPRSRRPNWPRLSKPGPDPAQHGVVRWRRIDLRDGIERRFGVTLHERSSGDCQDFRV